MVIKPWVHKNNWGRLNLRVDLTGVDKGRGALWHDVLWYYFYNNQQKPELQFATFADFRKQVRAKRGVRVDHAGGKPEKTDVFTLRLKGERKSAQEGAAQKRAYKTGGERVLLEARLRKVLKRPSRCKNVC